MTILTISLLTATSLANPVFAESPENCDTNEVSNGITLSIPTKHKGVPTAFMVETEATATATNNIPDPCNLEVRNHRVLINSFEVCTANGIATSVPGDGDSALFKNDGSTEAGACIVDLTTAIPFDGMDDGMGPCDEVGGCPLLGPWTVFAEWDGVVFNVDGTNETNNAGADDDGMTNLVVPDFKVTKTPDPIKIPINPMAEIQTTSLTWIIEIENISTGTGVMPLTNCVTDDDRNPDPFPNIPMLNPGQVVKFEYEDIVSATTKNTVTVTCQDQFMDEIEKMAMNTVVIYKPKVSLVKTCDPKVMDGAQAICLVTITNESPDEPKASLTNCLFTDLDLDTPIVDLPIGTIGDTPVVIGESDELKTPKLTAENSPYKNTASVECEDQEGFKVTAMGMATVLRENFDVNIAKDCEAKTVLPFNTKIDCKIDVDAPQTNTGDLTNCRVEDPSFGGVVSNPTPFDLAPGAVLPTINVSRDVLPADVAAMSVKNTATVTCSSQDNVDNVSKPAMDTVDIFSVAATVNDVCTPETQTAETPGSIKWTITLCNTSPDGKSDLTFNGAGTIEKCDLDGVTNCEGAVGEDEKTITNLVLPASDPFDADVSCETIDITKDELGVGKYTDIWSGIASMQAGNIPLDGMAMCSIDDPSDFNGCTPGYWKANYDKRDAVNWFTDDPNPDTLVTAVFSAADGNLDRDPAEDTLRDALSYRGGSGTEGAERILLRAATAAYLNIGTNAFDYEFGTILQLQTAVNNAINDGDDPRGAMLTLAATLDAFNNAEDEEGIHCPLDNAKINDD